jgi:hypothetical protein
MAKEAWSPSCAFSGCRFNDVYFEWNNAGYNSSVLYKFSLSQNSKLGFLFLHINHVVALMLQIESVSDMCWYPTLTWHQYMAIFNNFNFPKLLPVSTCVRVCHGWYSCLCQCFIVWKKYCILYSLQILSVIFVGWQKVQDIFLLVIIAVNVASSSLLNFS